MESAPVFHPAKSKYLVFTLDYVLPLLISLGIIALGYVALYSPLFQIKTIVCTLDYEECGNEAILSELAKFKGQNIFRLSPSSISTRLTSGDFTIREVEVNRLLPDKLSVALQSVYPTLALQITGDETWILLDNQLRVIGVRRQAPNVPVLVIPGPLTVAVGKVIDDQTLKDSLHLTSRLFDELSIIKSIALLDSNTIQLVLEDGKIALFTPHKDELTQLRLLQQVLSGVTIKEGVKIIDVRFARPVLR